MTAWRSSPVTESERRAYRAQFGEDRFCRFFVTDYPDAPMNCPGGADVRIELTGREWVVCREHARYLAEQLQSAIQMVDSDERERWTV